MKRVAIIIAVFTFMASMAWGGEDIPNGGFEGTTPNYFSSGKHDSSTAVMSWATDTSRTGGHSLKIVKTDTKGNAYWKSEDLFRYWSIFVGPYVGFQLGAFVKLEGVNTIIPDDSAKIQLIFNIYNAAGTNMLGGPYVIDVDQTNASTGWVEVKSGTFSFPVEMKKITAELRFGEKATGTAWLDDFFIRNTVKGEWAGDLWNPNVDLPTGWFDWWPNFSAGLNVGLDDSTMRADGYPTDWYQSVYAGQDTNAANVRTGDASLKLEKDSTGYELVVMNDITDFVNTGSALKFSAYVKTELPVGMATTANADPAAGIGFTVTWHDGTGGADGWGEVGGNDFRFTLAGDTTAFTEYTWTVNPPTNATQYSLRARYWHNFQGTSWWDDFTMEKLKVSENLLSKDQSGFEGGTPNYFKSGKADGSTATLSWATDQSRTGGHSIKIAKPTGNGEAYWESDDLYRYWSAGVGTDVGMQVGAWVKLSGVNTSPSSDAAKIQLIFNFLDKDGINLYGGPLVLDVPQTAATADWTEVKSTTPISFPVKVDDIKVKLSMGASATGTVWADDFFIRNTVDGEWAGDFFGPNVDTPAGWFYWWPDFSAGKAAWDTLVPVFAGQDKSVKRSGDASLKLEKDSTGYEVVVNSDFTPFINDGHALEFSAWVKTDLAAGMADSANADPSAGIGFTVTWHDDTGGEDGWGEVKGADAQFTLAGDVTDWTQYKALFQPPEKATQFSLRARYWHNFVGTTWWDDFQVVKVDTIYLIVDQIAALPAEFRLDKVYPNPFNPTATIKFDVPYNGMINIRVYDILGRSVARLMDQRMDAGSYDVRWNAITDAGMPLSTGIYFVRVQFDNRNVQVRKITYLK